MTCLKPTFSAPGTVPALAVLPALPQALTAQAILEIEQVLISALALLGRELFGAGVGMAPEPDAADIEYASWMPDPAALELASWNAQLRAQLR